MRLLIALPIERVSAVRKSFAAKENTAQCYGLCFSISWPIMGIVHNAALLPIWLSM